MVRAISMNLHIKLTILWIIIPVVSLYQHNIYVSEKLPITKECQQINNTTHQCSSIIEAFQQLSNCCNSTEITIEPGNYNLSLSHELADLHDIRIRSETKAVIQCAANVNGTFDFDTGIAFVRVRNLIITNISIVGCGMKHNSSNYIGAGKYNIIVRSALYIQNSTNIFLDNVNISESNGIGLLIYDTNGSVNITKTYFINNTLNSSEQSEHFTGGGGIYIEFTECPPGVTQCNSTSNTFNKLANYTIDNCVFEGNAAINHLNVREQKLKYLASRVFRTFGTGGGISLWLSGYAQNNVFQVTLTTFNSNRALYGGGLHVHNRHNAKNNNVQIEWCDFLNNSALLGGGGLILGYVIHPSGAQCSFNTFIVTNCMFKGNQAKIGGGVSGFGSREPGKTQNTNYFEVRSSSFINNGAQYGSAIQFNKEFFSYIVVGTIFTLVLDNCTFTNNSNKNNYSYNSSSVGAVAMSGVNVEFRRTTVFTNNTFTALIADGASVKFCNHSSTTFQNNSGLHGGAISLISSSLIIVYSNSTLLFKSNKALQYGGAIYVALSTPYDYLFSRTCFIKYYKDDSPSNWVTNITLTDKDDSPSNWVTNITLTDKDDSPSNWVTNITLTDKDDSPSNWVTNITFTDNTAGNNSNTIFASTLKPCEKAYNVEVKSLFNSSSWPFHYSSSLNDSINIISTSPAKFILSYPSYTMYTTVPGETFNIPVQLVDELGQNISSVMFIATCVGVSSGSPHILSTYHFTNGSVKIAGKPDEICQLKMKTDADYPVSTTIPVTLLKCPPGFVHNNKKAECECMVDYNRRNPAISDCDLTSYRAYFDRFYWIGYKSDDAEDLLISPCPYRYCYEDHISQDQLLPRDANRKALDAFVCGSRSRTGILCGECIKGYSVAVNSPTFTCHKCENPYLGILYLLLSYIIPVTILFYIIMAYNIRMTTGPIGAFLFFSQIISSQYRFAFDYSVKANSHGTLEASNILIAIYSISNLQFFHHDLFSYCLFPNVGTVDILAFNLLLSFYPILLVFVYFLIRRYCTQCYQKLRLSTKSVTHGVCAFLILCFVKINILAFGILRSADVSYVNGTSFRKVAYHQGSLEYFGKFSHGVYAVASIFITVTVISIPTMILVFHPIMILVVRYFEWGETRLVVFINKILFIHKLKPILDSFQGDYKYNLGFFAGLHTFLYRIIFFCIMVAVPTPDINTLLLLMIAYFIIILLTHVLVMPFKKHIDNVSYTLIYILMLTIVILELYLFSTGRSSPELIWLEIILSLVPFIFVALLCSWNCLLEMGKRIQKKHCCAYADDESQLVS